MGSIQEQLQLAIFPALALNPHNLFSLFMTLALPLLHKTSNCLPIPRVSAWECGQTFWEDAWFNSSLFSTGLTESPLFFTDRCYEGSSFQYWCSGMGSPVWGWDASLLLVDFRCQAIPPDSQLPLLGVGTACFVSLLFLPVSMCFFLYIISYRTLVS